MPKLTKVQETKFFKNVIIAAQYAAQEAGDEWIKNAKPKYVVMGYENSPMLDLCGNAHVRIDDGRTKFAKYLKEDDRCFGANTVPLNTSYSGRQEHGLKLAIAEAALKVLQDFGIKKCYIWEYID